VIALDTGTAAIHEHDALAKYETENSESTLSLMGVA